MGLGGICESDLRSAMTQLLFQGLAGRPGFISDPTMDESQQRHHPGPLPGHAEDGRPGRPAAPYKLRTVMERQEGVVPQVFDARRAEGDPGQAGRPRRDHLYFTGKIIDAPDVDRGCRTKITVKVDGDADSSGRTGPRPAPGHLLRQHQTRAGTLLPAEGNQDG